MQPQPVTITLAAAAAAEYAAAVDRAVNRLQALCPCLTAAAIRGKARIVAEAVPDATTELDVLERWVRESTSP